MFEVTVRPFAVDAQSLIMLSDGVFVAPNGLQYMGVAIKNTWGEAFEDELLFDISDAGRRPWPLSASRSSMPGRRRP